MTGETPTDAESAATGVSDAAVVPPDVVDEKPATSEAALDFMWQAFLNLNEWVRFSDTKAAAVLAADGVIVGVIATMLAGSGSKSLHTPVALIWLSAIVVVAFYSSVYALWSLLPQLKVRIPRRRNREVAASTEESSSLVFFMDIDKQFPTAKEFHEKIIQALVDPNIAVKQISQQIWSNSKVAAVKYNRVEKAIMGLGIALSLGFLGVVILAAIYLTEVP